MLSPGTRIAGRYTVLRELGSGGMGGVYEIEGDALANRMALKVIRSEYADNVRLKARFQREAKLQSQLDHPCIAKVIDLIEHEGTLAIVMEYVDAPTLREVLLQGRPDHARVREILTELVSALDAAHDAGVVHRDLKPENVFVLELKGGRLRCKLIDFGIARQLDDETANTQLTRLTHDQSFVGTYAYASPEQVTQSSTVDARSDLYSLGVLLWEMLAGVPPYSDLESAYSVQVAVVNEPLPALPADAPGELVAMVAELTRKAPEERPQSAHELMLRLQAPRPAPSAGLMATVPEGRAHPVAATVAEVGPPPIAPPSKPTPPKSAASKAPSSKAPSSKAPPPKRARQQVDRATVPALFSRVMARLADELVPQLLVLTCIGVLAYPVLVVRRGMGDGPSMGQSMFKVRTLDHVTGERATSNQVLARNLFDLFLIQLPLAGVIWPVGWPAGLPLIAGLWLLFILPIELFIAAVSSDGRRMVDFLAGTRMSRSA